MVVFSLLPYLLFSSSLWGDESMKTGILSQRAIRPKANNQPIEVKTLF